MSKNRAALFCPYTLESWTPHRMNNHLFLIFYFPEIKKYWSLNILVFWFIQIINGHMSDFYTHTCESSFKKPQREHERGEMDRVFSASLPEFVLCEGLWLPCQHPWKPESRAGISVWSSCSFRGSRKHTVLHKSESWWFNKSNHVLGFERLLLGPDRTDGVFIKQWGNKR